MYKNKQVTEQSAQPTTLRGFKMTESEVITPSITIQWTFISNQIKKTLKSLQGKKFTTCLQMPKMKFIFVFLKLYTVIW